MRRTLASALTTAAALLAAAVVVPCAAQPPAFEPGSPYVLTDSTRILPRWLEGQIQAGIGWMGSPTFERQRYQAGLLGALAAEARPMARLAVRARIAYQDLPPDPFDVYLADQSVTQFTDAIGHGNLFTGLLEVSTPLPWSMAVFGGAGGARYGSNAAVGVLLPDGTGFRALAESGWASAWSAGLRYAFRPNPRDHFFLEGRSESVDVAGGFRFWSLALGYRFP